MMKKKTALLTFAVAALGALFTALLWMTLSLRASPAAALREEESLPPQSAPNAFNTSPDSSDESPDDPADRPNGEVFTAGPGKNYLLLGTDQVSLSTDVIIVVRVEESGRIALLQIPRDTYTAAYGKINSLYAKNYRAALAEGQSEKEAKKSAAGAFADFLETSLSIEIAGSALITLDDFREIVDSVGGVDVVLPKSLDYDDNGQNLHIHLPAGAVHLDGKDAEGLVRCRSEYLTADYGRMDAQKLFLTAFYRKVRTTLSLPSLLLLALRTWRAVVTDLSLTQTLSLAKKAMNTDAASLCFASAKGRSVRVGAMSCEVIPKQTLDALARALGATEQDAVAAGTFCDGRENVVRAYESAPVYPLSFVFADEIEENGLDIR